MNQALKTFKLSITIAVIITLLTTQQFAMLQLFGDNSAVGNAYGDYGIATLNSEARVTLSYLNSLTSDNQSVIAYKQVIQDQFIAYNIRQVLLDIGWQNFTVGDMPYQQWVANWLAASDALGVKTEEEQASHVARFELHS